jgi:hypothetical protein
MANPDEEIPFDEAEPALVLDRMAVRTDAGKGWINLLPAVSDDVEVPQSGGLLSFLAARGPSIPMATWSAGAISKRGPGRDTIGLQHSSGPRAVARLADLGLGLPAGWVKVQDHPRRGLVVTMPPAQDHEDVLHWLLSAAHVLSAVPLTGHWLARVYGGDRS